MAEEPTHLLIVRRQCWFKPSVTVDGLPPFPVPEVVDTLKPSPPGFVYVRALIGRGPVSRTLPDTVMLYFAQGERPYPTFEAPGIGPSGASLHGRRTSRQLEISDQEALFLLEVGTFAHVSGDVLAEYQATVKDPGPEPSKSPPPIQFIEELRTKMEDFADVLVGVYALYQYPLVWSFLTGVTALVSVEAKTMAAKWTSPSPGDIVIPFLLDTSSKTSPPGVFQDAVIENAGKFVQSDLAVPLAFLFHGLREENPAVRFLQHFWIIEHLAVKRASKVPGADAFVRGLRRLVKQHFPEWLELFDKKRGELTRRPTLENIKFLFDSLSLPFAADFYRQALRLRNKISHGQPFDLHELVHADLELRKQVRELLRAEFAQSGVTFD